MKIIYCDMVADLFHYGHVNFLKRCKQLGDYLIVGIHSDSDVESYKRTPIINYQNRFDILKELKIVDQVIEAQLVLDEDFIKKCKCMEAYIVSFPSTIFLLDGGFT